MKLEQRPGNSPAERNTYSWTETRQKSCWAEHLPAINPHIQSLITQQTISNSWESREVGNQSTSKDNRTPVVNKITRLLGVLSQEELTVTGKTIIANVMGTVQNVVPCTVRTVPVDALRQVEQVVSCHCVYSTGRHSQASTASSSEIYMD